MDRKQLWYLWEKLVADKYISDGRVLQKTNFAIRWWELDIILSQNWSYKFVEVKVTNAVDDLYNFITSSKKSAMRRTINKYILEQNLDIYNTPVSVDIVFVRHWQIWEIYEDQEV